MIKQAKFVTSVADASKLPDYGVPEIAIAGKSNVGKSSFINFMVNQNKLAKTSQEPGRTRLLNYFEINNGEYYFVDLPGYGYAKVNKQEKQKWGGLIENYLRTSNRLINVFVLVDMRHEPTDDDKMLINYLYSYNIPFTIIATKADKLSRAQQQKCLSVIATALCVGTKDILVTSASAKTGKENVLSRIEMLLANTECTTSKAELESQGDDRSERRA
ncbi:MAG TPA: YihA family ribosome biogenesis GTP-binding protein [Clostridiales bacterium]|nr:YihA family ribosome biogenesis GTP-binding protein [Clostridiales bacterium]